MAYDAGSAYEPPRRGYGGGYGQQQAPVQNGYYGGGRGDPYEESGYAQEYAQDQRGYEQSYVSSNGYDPQDYRQHAGAGRGQRHYTGGSGRGQQPPRQEDRQYDPRYQSRARGGGQPGAYEQQPPQQRRQQQQYDQDYQQERPRDDYAGPPRDDRRFDSGNEQPQRHRDDQAFDPRRQQNGYQQPPQGMGSGGGTYGQNQLREDSQYEHRDQPRTQLRQQPSRAQLPRQPAPPQSPPSAQTSRPSQDYDVQSRPNPANVRQYAQQTEQQKQAIAKQRAHGMTPQPAPHSHSAPAVPQAAQQSHHSQPNHSSKMSMEEWKAQAKAKMHADAASPQVMAQDNAFPTFPHYEHKSKGSTSAASNSGDNARPSTSNGGSRPHAARDNSYQREVAGSGGPQSLPRPSLDHKPYSFDAVQSSQHSQSQVPPEAQTRPQYQRDMSSQDGNAQGPRSQGWPIAEAEAQHADFSANTRQPPSRAAQMQPIDTRQAQEQRPIPAYLDHQPLSPASVPQRPSTAQAARSAPRAYHITNQAPMQTPPVPQNPQYLGVAAQPKNQRETLSDIYDVYANDSVPPPTTGPPRTREAEIEMEMPDFDSAAPGGTSLLHKRSQKHDQHPNTLAQSGVPPMPLKQGGISHGFSFGIPGEQVTRQVYEEPFQQKGYPPSQPSHGPPVQPPFATEHVPRRSLDDARPVPYRNGPPAQQRPYQGGGPPKGPGPRGGPMPPHIRPEMDRGFTNQTVRSDPGPGQFRGGGSAPPMRQGLRGPPPPDQGPGRDAGPLTRQPSAPQQHNQQQRHSNPDALPSHPTPVRAGLMNGGAAQPARPPPVRHYNNNTSPPPQQQHARQPSLDVSARPVTNTELDQLRAAVSANPNNPKQSLLLAKKLVEASNILASEGGRLDAKSTAINRERYITDAHKIVKRLVGQNYPDAQFYLADCYGSGQLGLEPDTREAFNHYQAAAKGGHAEAAYRTAMCCEMGAEEGGGTRRDYAKALQWYRRAATLGDASGMFKLGMILLKGLLGQPKNVGDAVTWLKRASERADKDNPYPLYEMAQLYESANNNPEVRNKVVADDKYALDLFQKAAQWGHKASQFRLGQAYEYGNLGLVIDNRASIMFYTKAAAQGEHNAELALSGWYLTGADGILEQSDTEAYLWARKAATSEPPLAKAMFAMGYFTETGIGCPASIDEAKRWYGRAACKFSVIFRISVT